MFEWTYISSNTVVWLFDWHVSKKKIFLQFLIKSIFLVVPEERVYVGVPPKKNNISKFHYWHGGLEIFFVLALSFQGKLTWEALCKTDGPVHHVPPPSVEHSAP